MTADPAASLLQVLTVTGKHAGTTGRVRNFLIGQYITFEALVEPKGPNERLFKTSAG
jgi:hypothetical protein